MITKCVWTILISLRLQIDIDFFYRMQSHLTSQFEHQSRLGIDVGVSFRDRVNHIHNLNLAPTLIITRAWYGMEDDFSIFHTGNFLPFHFHSIPKIFHSIFHSILKFSSIFHSILKFSSIFHSILPYQRNFRLEAMQRIFCCFAPLQCCKQPLVKVCQQY